MRPVQPRIAPLSDDDRDGQRELLARQQLIQATMLVGYYHLVSFVLNSLTMGRSRLTDQSRFAPTSSIQRGCAPTPGTKSTSTTPGRPSSELAVAPAYRTGVGWSRTSE
jgi:hypothetical protein